MQIIHDNTNPCSFQTALRIPQDLRRQIEGTAGRRGFSAFIRQAIAEKLEREAA